MKRDIFGKNPRRPGEKQKVRTESVETSMSPRTPNREKRQFRAESGRCKGAVFSSGTGTGKILKRCSSVAGKILKRCSFEWLGGDVRFGPSLFQGTEGGREINGITVTCISGDKRKRCELDA